MSDRKTHAEREQEQWVRQPTEMAAVVHMLVRAGIEHTVEAEVLHNRKTGNAEAHAVVEAWGGIRFIFDMGGTLLDLEHEE